VNVGASPQAGSAAYKAALDMAKILRLAAAPTTGVAAVSGTIKLTSLNVVNSAGTPTPGTGALGSLTVWIIDPGDDILTARFKTTPDATGAFTLQIPNPPTRAVLAVNFKVQDDLNGDGTPGDTISQRYVVALAADRTSKVNFDFKQQAGLQPTLPPPGGGAATPVVVTTIVAQDPDGDHTVLRASDYKAKTTVTDVDGDGQFDPLRDLILADANGDSLSDSSATLYANAAAYADVYGLVTRVDEFKRQADVLVRVDKTTSYTVKLNIDPQAAIDVYIPAGPPAGQFGELKLGQFLVGRNVYADGYYTDGGAQRAQTTFAFTVIQ
jgi:hypothetical protein